MEKATPNRVRRCPKQNNREVQSKPHESRARSSEE